MSETNEERYWEAVDMLDEGNPEGALVAADELLAVAPTDIDYLELRGLALGALGDHDEALTTFRRLVELDPADVDGHARVAEVLMELGQIEEAEQTVRAMLEMAPEHAIAYGLRGFLHDVAGRSVAADADYAKSVALDEELGPVPPRLTDEEFAVALADCKKDLEGELGDALARLTIEVKNLPSLELVRDPTNAITLSSPAVTIPNYDDDGTGRLLIFKRNVERLVFDLGELEEQLEAILVEELEHFIGADAEEES
jgi:tetratricopeptide (TPR) repeat protein